MKGRKSLKSRFFAVAAVVVTALIVVLLPQILNYGKDISRISAEEAKQLYSQGRFSDINSDYVCRLYIEGTDVDFPVVRGSDNEKYLHTSFFGEGNQLGAIFMDYRCGSKDMPHTIIYGHDAQDLNGNRLMFGHLREFIDEEYIAKHGRIKLLKGSEEAEYRIFAVKITDIRDESYRLDFENREDFTDFAEDILAPGDTKGILTLSTCLGSNEDLRLLVQGELVSEKPLDLVN